MATFETREEVEKLGIIDPELKQLLEATPQAPRPDVNDVAANRKGMAALEAMVLQALGPPAPGTSETTSSITMRDGHQNPCKIVQPTNSSSSAGKPLIVLFFGGGHQLGSIDQLVPDARAFTKNFNAVCVCAGYRLAPENPFPAGANDAWDTLQYVAANAATTFNADPASGFVVGGVSAGAALSGVVTQLAKDNNLSPPLTGQWLSIPGFVHESTVPRRYAHLFFSREQNANAPGFNKETRDALVAAHKPDFSSPLYCPINSPSGQTGLPAAFLQSCGMDPLRDDSLIYEKMLREAGVRTKIDVYPGQPHGFWYASPLKEKAWQVRADIVKGMGWLLGKEVSDQDARQPFEKLYEEKTT